MKSKYTPVFLLFLIVFVSRELHAQTDTTSTAKVKKTTTTMTLGFENGSMLRNSVKYSDQLIDASYYNGVLLNIGFRNNDLNDVYNQVYRYPIMGVGFYTSTFHNVNIGKPNALYYFFNIPFSFENNRHFTLSYNGAFGISYNFNRYDSIANPTNTMIGSYKNCYIHLGISLYYHFNPIWALNLSYGITHFSNGAFKQPNYGINLFPLTIALNYTPQGNERFVERISYPAFIKNNQINLSVAVGSKNYEKGYPNYFKSTFSLNWLRAQNYKYRIGLGADIFFSAQHTGIGAGSYVKYIPASTSFALVGCWEWVLTKRVYVPLGLGVYLIRQPDKDESKPYYERAGIRYRVTDHVYAGLTIKAHQGAADFFEWTAGYTFHKDPNKY